MKYKIIPLLIIVFFIKTINAQDKMSRYEELRKLSRDSLIKIADEKLKAKYKDYKKENFPRTVVKAGMRREEPVIIVYIDNTVGFAPIGGYGARGFECELVSDYDKTLNFMNEKGTDKIVKVSLCGDSIYKANMTIINDCMVKINRKSFFPSNKAEITTYFQISETEEYYLLRSETSSSLTFYRLYKSDCRFHIDHWADLIPNTDNLKEIK